MGYHKSTCRLIDFSGRSTNQWTIDISTFYQLIEGETQPYLILFHVNNKIDLQQPMQLYIIRDFCLTLSLKQDV